MSIFVDNDETREWMTYLQTLNAPPTPVSLPSGDDLVAVLRYLDIPEGDIPGVTTLAGDVPHDPVLWDVLQRAVWSLIAHMGTIEGPPRFAALRDPNDPTYRFFYVLVFVAALPYVRDHHRRQGIPDDIARATLADLGRNVRVHRKREGVGGLGVMWWLMLHFRGMIYQLGRLQFERSTMGEQIAQSAREAGHDVSETTPVLSIHIPDFMGPMTPEACDASIHEASSFFARYFPDDRYEYAVCHSWLLDPQLEEHLRPGSNIVRFQERFHSAGQGWDSTDGIMQFVFGKTAADIDAVSPETSLERAVVNHIRAGGKWWGYGGWFRLDEGTPC